MMLQDKIVKAVQLINPNAQFGLSGDNIDDIVWEDGTTPISVADIEAKMVEVQAEYDANQYQRDRVYPSIQEQLDMQYWDSVNGTTTWNDTITKIKTDNPKN
jgi:hypothetical protein